MLGDGGEGLGRGFVGRNHPYFNKLLGSTAVCMRQLPLFGNKFYLAALCLNLPKQGLIISVF